MSRLHVASILRDLAMLETNGCSLKAHKRIGLAINASVVRFIHFGYWLDGRARRYGEDPIAAVPRNLARLTKCGLLELHGRECGIKFFQRCGRIVHPQREVAAGVGK